MSPPAKVIPIDPNDPPQPALLLAFPRAGSRAAQSRELPGAGFLLGRGEAIFDEPFEDPAMAPRHAEVRFRGQARRRDRPGEQDRYPDQRRRPAETKVLAEGDVLRLGDTVFVYSNRARLPGGIREARLQASPSSRARRRPSRPSGGASTRSLAIRARWWSPARPAPGRRSWPGSSTGAAEGPARSWR